MGAAFGCESPRTTLGLEDAAVGLSPRPLNAAAGLGWGGLGTALGLGDSAAALGREGLAAVFEFASKDCSAGGGWETDSD